MIRWSVSLALGMILGVVTGLSPAHTLPAWNLALLASCGAALAAAVLRAEWNWRPSHPAWTVLACLMLSFPVGHLRTASRLHGAPPESLRARLASIDEGQTFKLAGTIGREPDWRGNTLGELHIRVRAIQRDGEDAWLDVTRGNVQVRLTIPAAAVAADRVLFDDLMHPDAYGYAVEVVATRRTEPVPLNPGGFDQRAFLLQNDVELQCRTRMGDIRIVARTRGFFATELALAAKARFLSTYRETIRSPASRLVAAATLGSRRAVERIPYRGLNIAAMFRAAGMGHVLAVSGLHVSVVSLLLFWMFAASGLRPRAFAPLHIVFLILFALLTGARPAVVRAVVMNGAIVAAFAYVRCNLRQATWVGLALSSMGILVVNPLVLFSPSFLLSFGAVLSLVILAPPVDRWLCQRRGASLILTLLWAVGVLVAVSLRPDAAVRAPFWIGATAAAWLLAIAGDALNRRLPWLWRVGLERLPASVRLLFAAQIAIQIGMMVPMSAWFFGRFPVAGSVVAVYYAGVAALVLLDARRAFVRGLWLRLWQRLPESRAVGLAWAALPCALLAAAWASPRLGAPACERITCAAVRQYPVLVCTSDAKTSVLVNAGDAYAVGRAVFGVLRTHGSVDVEALLLPCPDQRAGVAGAAELMRTVRVKRCLVPVDVPPGGSYLAAVGDDYLTRQASSGRGQLARYDAVYEELTAAARELGVALLPPDADVAPAWRNFSLDVLPLPEALPRAMISRALSRVVRLEANGFSWVVLSDATDLTFEAYARGGAAPCDVLVLPDHSGRRDYGDFAAAAVRVWRPRVVIFGGDRAPRGIDCEAWASDHGVSTAWSTGADGAVSACFRRGAMTLETHLTGRRAVLTTVAANGG